MDSGDAVVVVVVAEVVPAAVAYVVAYSYFYAVAEEGEVADYTVVAVGVADAGGDAADTAAVDTEHVACWNPGVGRADAHLAFRWFH